MSAAEIRRPDLMVDEFAFWDECATAAAVLTTEDTEGHRAGMAGPEVEQEAAEETEELLEAGRLTINLKGWPDTPEERNAREWEIVAVKDRVERRRLQAMEDGKGELLLAGTAVVVLVEHSWHWTLVRLPEGRRLWVRSAYVEKVTSNVNQS